MDTNDAAVVGGCGCYFVWVAIVLGFWALVAAALIKYVF